MAKGRRAARDRRGIAGIVGVLVVTIAALFVLMESEHGGFSRFARASNRLAIPGVTVENAAGTPVPVVTSVRTDSEAQRRGVRVGDDIVAVDGRRVRDVDALRDAVFSTGADAPLDLHIRRGDAVWTVSLDRAEPAVDTVTNVTELANGAENPAN